MKRNKEKTYIEEEREINEIGYIMSNNFKKLVRLIIPNDNTRHSILPCQLIQTGISKKKLWAVQSEVTH
jgi:hypothetical protein